MQRRRSWTCASKDCFLRLEVAAQTKKARPLYKVLASIFYALDARTQYLKLDGAKRKRREAKARVDKQVQRLRPKPQIKFSEDVVLRGAIAHHLQQCLRPGLLYSLPGGIARHLSLDTALSKGQQHARATIKRNPLVLEIDDHDNDMGLQESAEGGGHVVVAEGLQQPALAGGTLPVFFKLVSSRPSALKVVQLPGAYGRQLRQHDLCVTFHTATKDNGVTLVQIIS